MPDIEKIKINARTAVLAFAGTFATVFLAGGWFFGIRQMQSDVVEMKVLLIEYNKHMTEIDKDVILLKRDMQMIKDYNGIKTPRGLQ